MNNGVGIQSFSLKNLNWHEDGKSTHLNYTVHSGDTIDGIIASSIKKLQMGDLENKIYATYAKNQGLNSTKMTPKQKDDALLWFADVQSQEIIKDSKGIPNRNEIKPGDTLVLDSYIFGTKTLGLNA